MEGLWEPGGRLQSSRARATRCQCAGGGGSGQGTRGQGSPRPPSACSPGSFPAHILPVWKFLGGNRSQLQVGSPPAALREPVLSPFIHQLLRPRRWPEHVLRGPGRAARSRELRRHISASGGVCMSEVRAWLWNYLLFLLPPLCVACPGGPGVGGELAGPAGLRLGAGLSFRGHGRRNARAPGPGAGDITVLSPPASILSCAPKTPGIWWQSSGLLGVRRGAAEICFCRISSISAFLNLLFRYLMVCVQTESYC